MDTIDGYIIPGMDIERIKETAREYYNYKAIEDQYIVRRGSGYNISKSSNYIAPEVLSLVETNSETKDPLSYLHMGLYPENIAPLTKSMSRNSSAVLLNAMANDKLGKEFIEKSRTALSSKGSIILRMGSGESRYTNTEGIFGINIYGNSVSYSDGTIYTKPNFNNDSVYAEYNSRMARGVFYKGQYVELTDFTKLSKRSNEYKTISKREDFTGQNIYKFTLSQYGSNKTREDTGYSIIYATEDRLREFFNESDILAVNGKNGFEASQIGRRIIDSAYTVLPNGQIRFNNPAYSYQDRLLDITALEANRITAEHAVRKIEDGNLQAFTNARAVKMMVEKTFGSTAPENYQKFRNAIVKAGTGNGMEDLNSILYTAKQNNVDFNIIRAVFSPEVNMPSLMDASGWVNAFSAKRDKNLLFSIGQVDNAFFMAQNIAPDSRLAYISDHFWDKAISIVNNDEREEFIKKQSAINKLLIPDVLQYLLGRGEELGPVNSRLKNVGETMFFPLTFSLDRFRRKGQPQITSSLGIELDMTMTDESIDRNLFEIMRRHGYNEAQKKEKTTQLKTLYNFFRDVADQQTGEVKEILNQTIPEAFIKEEFRDNPKAILKYMQSVFFDLSVKNKDMTDAPTWVNGVPNPSSFTSMLLNTADDDFKKFVEERFEKKYRTITDFGKNRVLENFMNMDGSQNNYFRTDEAIKAYGKDKANKMALVYKAQQQSVDKYGEKIKSIIHQYGGEMFSSEDGRIYAQFSGEKALRIDQYLPRLQQIGPVSYFRLRSSNYMTGLDYSLKTDKKTGKGYLDVRTQLDVLLEEMFGFGDKKGKASTLMERVGKTRGYDSYSDIFEYVLKDVAKSLRESGLQGESQIHDINSNYALRLEELLTNEGKREELKNYLADIDISNLSEGDAKKVAEVESFLANAKGNNAFTGQRFKNILSELILADIIPGQATLNVKGYNPATKKIEIKESADFLVSRSIKASAANRNGTYSLLNFALTGTSPFDSLGRGIEYVDSNTIRTSRKFLSKRGEIPGLKIAKTLAENPLALVHKEQLAAMTEAGVLKSTSFFRAMNVEATSADVDRIADLVEKELIGQGLNAKTAKRLADRFHNRTNIFEGGGSISGRYLTASNQRQGIKYIDATSKNLEKDNRWLATDFEVIEDKNGNVKGIKYGKGYIVKPGENVLEDFSEYLNTSSDNEISNASVVRRKIAAQDKIVLSEEEVLDYVKNKLGKKDVTEKELRDYINKEMRQIAEVSSIKDNAPVKILGALQEKHVLVKNIDNLMTAAAIAEEKARAGLQENTSSLKTILDSRAFKQVNALLQKELDVNLAKDNIDYEILLDMVTGKFNHELWKDLRDKAIEGQKAFIDEFFELVRENNRIHNNSLEKELDNIFALSDAVQKVTGGADIISSEAIESLKHGHNGLIQDTWLRLVRKQEASGKLSGREAYKAAFNEIKDVFSGGEVSVNNGMLVFGYDDPTKFFYDPQALIDLRKKHGFGETVTGDYLDEEGRLLNNLVNKEGFVLSEGNIQFIRDAVNFDKKPSWGIREQFSLYNNIIDEAGLEETRRKMVALGQEDLFNSLFGSLDLANEEQNKYRVWAKSIENGQSAGSILLDAALTWNPDDREYIPSAEPKTWIEREKNRIYKTLMDYKDEKGFNPYRSMAIGDKFIESMAINNAGSIAYDFHRSMNEINKLGSGKNEAFKNILSELAKDYENNILSIDDIPSNLEDMLAYAKFSEKNGVLDKGVFMGHNSIFELYGENDDYLKEVLGEHRRYMAVPATSIKSILKDSDTPDIPIYQRKAVAVAEAVKNLRDFTESGKNGDLTHDEFLAKQSALESKLLESFDAYEETLKGQFQNKKSTLIKDRLSPRFEFGLRAKTQVRDYGSLIKGRVTGEAEKWKFNSKSFAELAKNNVLPSFTIASTQDLAKFGYTDDYFEKTAKMLGYDKSEVDQFKKMWLKRAQTEGVEVLVNRSPSDYLHSSNVSKLFFSDNIGSGVFITDSITAAKMKNDSDGDQTLAIMLGARSSINKTYGDFLDLNTYNAYTMNGQDTERIAKLEERYGAETIKKLQALNNAFQKNYAYDAYYENKGWLNKGSSIGSYAQFASKEYAEIRNEKLIENFRKYIEQNGVDGKIFGAQREVLTKAGLDNMTKAWETAWSKVGLATTAISSNQNTDEELRFAGEEIMSRVKKSANVIPSYKEGMSIFDFYNELNTRGNDYEKSVLANLVISNARIKTEDVAAKLWNEDTKAAEDIAKGIREKRRFINTSTIFALANHQQGVGEIDPGLFLVDVARERFEAENGGISKEENIALNYFRESAKEGFLTTKKGEYNIPYEKTRMAGDFKESLSDMIKYSARVTDAERNKYMAARGRVREIMMRNGLDIMDRFEGYKDLISDHKSGIDMALNAMDKVMESFTVNDRKNVSQAAANYMLPYTELIQSEAAKLNEAPGRYNMMRTLVGLDNSVMSGWKEQIEQGIKDAAENMKKARNQRSFQTAVTDMARNFGARRKTDLSTALRNMPMPKFDKWAKIGLGIVGAGFIGGNPSEPSGYEANKYARKPSSIPQPQYRDQAIAAPEYSRNQQGYVVNINARSPRNMTDSGINSRISKAITATYSNNNVTINTNMHYKQDEISNADLADYLASAL